MNFKVEIQSYDQLSAQEKKEVPNNGGGKEYASYLRISNKGKTLYLESDAMEPEDCRFSRDLSWIADALRDAYSIGLNKGASW